MTTIVYAYDEGIIAYDSRESEKDGTITDNNCNKKQTVKGVHFITSGYVSDNNEIVRAYFGEDYRKEASVGALIDDKGRVYLAGIGKDSGFWKQELKNSHVIGSGSDHAWTALDFDCTAVEAVKMAMKRDCFTGGRIRAHKVKL